MTTTPDDRDILITDVRMDGAVARFSVGDKDYVYAPGRGTFEANKSGEPLHYSRDGSYCLSNGHSFGKVLHNANYLGAQVYAVRE